MDIVTLGAALNGSKAYTDQVTQSLMGGVHYRGSVSYYSDLPNDAAEGDSYTVKYAGTSGTVADGTEYTWGYDTDSQDFAWISFSKDTYSKAEIDNKLVGSNIALTGYTKGTTAKQDVSPTDNVNQGLGKIEKRVSDNENNILINDILSRVVVLQGYTLESASNLWQQGKHIWGQLIFKVDTGYIPTTTTTIALMPSAALVPKHEIISSCYAGSSESDVRNIAYFNFTLMGTMEVTAYEATNTHINIQLNYTTS